jgi:hypothetical protein
MLNLSCPPSSLSPGCRLHHQLMLMLTHIERESSKSGRSQKDEFGVSWTHDGQGFIIRNREDFVAKILPLFFSHTKFPSFIRKLYRWGFRKMCIPAKGQDGKMGDLIFAHEHFKRDNSNSIMANMKSVTAAGTRRAIANLMKNKTDNTRTCCEKAAEVAPAAAGLKKPPLPPWSRDQHEKGGTSSTGSFIFGASAAPTAGTTSRSASGTIMTAIASSTPSRMVGILPKQRPPADMLVTGSSSSSSQQSIQGGHHVLEEALRSTFSGGVDLYSRNDFEICKMSWRQEEEMIQERIMLIQRLVGAFFPVSTAAGGGRKDLISQLCTINKHPPM